MTDDRLAEGPKFFEEDAKTVYLRFLAGRDLILLGTGDFGDDDQVIFIFLLAGHEGDADIEILLLYVLVEDGLYVFEDG